MDDWLVGVCSLLGTPPSIAAMPREDKPFSGVSWWWGSACCGGGGFLIRELWGWQGPSLLSVQPSRETFAVGFNSRLTSLSASGVRRQTCKDLVQKQRVWNKSLSHYKAAENQPPTGFFLRSVSIYAIWHHIPLYCGVAAHVLLWINVVYNLIMAVVCSMHVNPTQSPF